MKSLAYALTIIFTVFIIGSFITNPAYAWGYEQKDLEMYERCNTQHETAFIISIVWSGSWFIMMAIAIYVILKYRKDDASKDDKDKDCIEDEDDSGDKNTTEENSSEEENNNDLENKDEKSEK